MKVCLECEYETENYGELYCKYCGNELALTRRKFEDLTKTDDGEKRILVSIVDQNTILEMIRSDWGRAMKKTEEKEKPEKREEMFESSWLTKKVESSGIVIKRISKAGEATDIVVSIANDCEDGGFKDVHFIKVLDDEWIPDIWNDLTDILLLPCNSVLKRRYMREFVPTGKPYEHAVDFESLYVKNPEKGNKNGQHDSTR